MTTTRYRQARMSVLEVSGIPEAFHHASPVSQQQSIVRNIVNTSVNAGELLVTAGVPDKRNSTSSKMVAGRLLMYESFTLAQQARELLHNQLIRIYKAVKETIPLATGNINEEISLRDKTTLLSTSMNESNGEFSTNLPLTRDCGSTEIHNSQDANTEGTYGGFLIC